MGVLPFSIRSYGWMNLLWFSNIAMILTVFALWLEHRVLMGMMALSVCLFDSLWIVDWSVAFLFGFHPIGGTEYMFDDSMLLFLRNFSLYHLVLPVILLYGLSRLGYDRRCLFYQTGFAWLILWIVFLFSERSANINWVFGPVNAQSGLHPWFYFSLVLLVVPLVVYLPLHAVFVRFFGRIGETGLPESEPVLQPKARA